MLQVLVTWGHFSVKMLSEILLRRLDSFINVISRKGISIIDKKESCHISPQSSINTLSWCKMAVILQKTFSNSFSSMKIVEFWFKLPDEKKIGHRDCSRWAHGDQNGHSQPWLEPWPGPWLSCDLAVTEPWSPWLSCDLAVTELWPSRDWAVTSPWPSLAVTEPWSLGPGAVTTVVTVNSPWAHCELTVTIYFLMGTLKYVPKSPFNNNPALVQIMT